MPFLEHPTAFSYIALAVFGLPTFLRGMLALLREWDDYRANRSRVPRGPVK